MSLASVNLTRTCNFTSYGIPKRGDLHDPGDFKFKEPDNSLGNMAHVLGHYLSRIFFKEQKPKTPQVSIPEPKKPKPQKPEPDIKPLRIIPTPCAPYQFDRELGMSVQDYRTDKPSAQSISAYQRIDKMRDEGPLTRGIIETVVCLNPYWIVHSVALDKEPVDQSFSLNTPNIFPLFNFPSSDYSLYLRAWFWQSYEAFSLDKNVFKKIPDTLISECWDIFTNLHTEDYYCMRGEGFCDDLQLKLAKSFEGFFADFVKMMDIKSYSLQKNKIALSYLHAFAPERLLSSMCPELYSTEVNAVSRSLELVLHIHDDL